MPFLSTPPITRSQLIAVIGGFVLFVAMWAYVLTVWPLSMDRFSDLYPRWYGSRELLLHGRNPYSPDVTQEIQEWQRGRVAMKGEDEGRFAYPIYVAFVLAPTTLFTFGMVSRATLALLAACAVGCVWGFARVSRWPQSASVDGMILLYSLSSFAVVFGLRVEQLALFVGCLLAASLVLTIRNHLAIAGVLLAFATIKPQLTGLLALWLLAWSVSDWPRRKKLCWGFLITLGILVGGSEILVKDWIPQFFRAMSAYGSYTYDRSILMVLFTRNGGILASIAILAVTAFECSRTRRLPAQTLEFAFCSSLVLTTTLAIIPTLAAHGQIVALPAILLLLRHWRGIWNAGRPQKYALLFTGALLAWPSLFAVGFWLIEIFRGAMFARRFWLLPVGGTPLLPLVATLALLVSRKQLLDRQD